jgi:hypothetical protein
MSKLTFLQNLANNNLRSFGAKQLGEMLSSVGQILCLNLTGKKDRRQAAVSSCSNDVMVAGNRQIQIPALCHGGKIKQGMTTLDTSHLLYKL